MHRVTFMSRRSAVLSRTAFWLATMMLPSAANSQNSPPVSPPTAASAQQAAVQYIMTYGGPVSAWPRPVPMRARPTGRDDVFVLTLGDAETPLASGTYDPMADRATLNGGGAIDNYYKQSLGVAEYRPIDKTVFPVPLSGWCTWYYHYHEIDAKDVLEQAKWIRDNMRPWGMNAAQLDDGWQGAGRGMGDNRDWTTINERFREPGIPQLADEIRKLNLLPGIWIAPHGQSNADVAKKAGVFLRKPDGSSPSDSWAGKFLIDPTAPESWNYLRDTMSALADGGMPNGGFGMFKIDGLPVVQSEFERCREFMQGKPTASAPADAAAAYLRGTLQALRAGASDDAFLLGSWGVPLAGVGILNAGRTGPDVTPDARGFLTAVDAIQRWGFLHNMVWYCDPDCVLVRPPIGENIARAWATAIGLSGQNLMAGDRLTELPEPRLDMLRRVFPATDVRPLDLFQPLRARKPLWVLAVSHPLFNLPPPKPGEPLPKRNYTIVGAFNYDDRTAETRHIRWQDIGLDPAKAYHVYDFWQHTYLGAFAAGVFIDVPPQDVRVLTIMADDGKPVVLTTNRHITQGWLDLRRCTREQQGERIIFRGESTVMGGDPYRLVFGLPRDKPWKITGVTVTPATAIAPASGRFFNQRSICTLQIDSKYQQTLTWEVVMERAEVEHYPVQSPAWVNVEPADLDGASVSWDPQYNTKAGYEVLVDDQPVGVAFGPSVVVRDLMPGKQTKIGVRSVWYDGTWSDAPAERVTTLAAPSEIALAALPIDAYEQDWGEPQRDRSVERRSLTVGGKTYAGGIGTHGDCVLRYRLYGLMSRLRGSVGVDDERDVGPATFEIACDGVVKWTSAPIQVGTPPAAFDIDISGSKALELRVRGKGAHADWIDVKLVK